MVRKVWNPKSFHSHVSPHFIMNEINELSLKRFGVGSPNDCFLFLNWMIDHLSKSASKVVQNSVQGVCKISTLTPIKDEFKIEEKENVFSVLSLDLPEMPIFKSKSEKIIIPQISIFSLLTKFDGINFH